MSVPPPRPTHRPAGPWDDLMVNPDTPPRITRVRRDNRGFVWGFVAGVILALGLYGGIVAVSDHATADVPLCTDAIADAGGICRGEPVPECATEDSRDCYWDATRGNGLGRSFVDVGGVTHYQPVR